MDIYKIYIESFQKELPNCPTHFFLVVATLLQGQFWILGSCHLITEWQAKMDFSKNNYPTTAQLYQKVDMTRLSLGWIWVADKAEEAVHPINLSTYPTIHQINLFPQSPNHPLGEATGSVASPSKSGKAILGISILIPIFWIWWFNMFSLKLR